MGTHVWPFAHALAVVFSLEELLVFGFVVDTTVLFFAVDEVTVLLSFAVGEITVSFLFVPLFVAVVEYVISDLPLFSL